MSSSSNQPPFRAESEDLTKERRRVRRIPASGAVMASWTGKDRRFHVIETAAKDVSAEGIELEIERPLPAAQEILIEFSDGTCRWGEVRHCDFTEGSYRVGIEFESEQLGGPAAK